MSRIAATALAFCLAFAAAGAFADDSMGKDSMGKKDAMGMQKKDSMGKQSARKPAKKKDAMHKKDGMGMKKDSMSREGK